MHKTTHSLTFRDNHIVTLLSSKVTVSEPEYPNDPAAVAKLEVLRSTGGKGAVTLRWQLEDQAKDDLSPLNGTLVFTEVHNRNSGVAVPSHIEQHSQILHIFVLQCLNKFCYAFIDGVWEVISDQSSRRHCTGRR